MRTRITKLLGEVNAAQLDPGAYAFLPNIVATLEAMKGGGDLPDDERHRLASGLGRLVLEDFEFASSSLGEALVELADDFAAERSPDTRI